VTRVSVTSFQLPQVRLNTIGRWLQTNDSYSTETVKLTAESPTESETLVESRKRFLPQEHYFLCLELSLEFRQCLWQCQATASSVTNICTVWLILIIEIFGVFSCHLTRNNGLKLYKAHCNINARKSFFTNRIVDIWNSIPAAVVFSHNVYYKTKTGFSFSLL